MAIEEFKKINGISKDTQQVQHNTWLQFNKIKKSLKDSSIESADQIKALNDQINDLQTQIDAIVNTNPFPNGNFINMNFPSGGGTTAFAHGLGRVPVGWIIVDINADAGISYRAAWDSSTITFVHASSVPFIARMWVY